MLEFLFSYTEFYYIVTSFISILSIKLFYDKLYKAVVHLIDHYLLHCSNASFFIFREPKEVLTFFKKKKNTTYPVGVNDVNNDSKLALVLPFIDVDHTPNLGELFERLKRQITK